MDPLRVLLVAQSPVLRIGIRGLLDGPFPSADVVEAEGALESVPLVGIARPDLIVIQDALPGVTGVVAARMLRELRPGAVIVVLSDQADESAVAAATRHGADALLSSTVRTEHFVAAVSGLLAEPPAAEDRMVPADAALVDGETLRAEEIAILDGFARGLAPRELADRLLVSEQTVRARAAVLVRKLNAVDRTTAVVAAVRRGFVDLSVQLPSAHLAVAGTGTAWPGGYAATMR